MEHGEPPGVTEPGRDEGLAGDDWKLTATDDYADGSETGGGGGVGIPWPH